MLYSPITIIKYLQFVATTIITNIPQFPIKDGIQLLGEL